MATLTSEEVALAAVEDNPEGSKTGRGHLGQQVHVQVGKALEDEGGRDVPCRVEGRVAGQVASCERSRDTDNMSGSRPTAAAEHCANLLGSRPELGHRVHLLCCQTRAWC